MRFLVISLAVVILVAAFITGVYLVQRRSSPRPYLEEMHRALGERDYARALAAYEKAVERGHHAVSRNDHLVVAELYLRVDPPRREDAVQEFLAALRNDPKDPEVHMALARLYRKMGDREGATKEAREVIATIDPENFRNQLLAAEAQWIIAEFAENPEQRMECLREAERAVRNAVERGGPSLEAYRAAIGSWRTYGSLLGAPGLPEFLHQEIASLNTGDRRALEAAVDQILSRTRTPGCADYVLYGDMSNLLGKWEEAARALKAALQDPSSLSPSCLATLALISVDAGDVETADEFAQAAVRGDPAMETELDLVLARGYWVAGQREKASEILDRLSKKEIGNPDDLALMALLRIEQRDFKTAEALLARYEEIGGDPEVATGMRGLMELRRGRIREAARMLDSVEDNEKLRRQSWFVLATADVRTQLGDLAGAASVLEEAWRRGVRLPDLHLLLADVNLRMRRYDEAMRWLDLARLTNPGDPREELLRARLAMERGQWSLAEEILRGLAESPGAESEAHYLLGIVYRRTDRPDEARRQFEAALETAKEAEWPRTAMELARLARLSGDLVEARDRALEVLKRDPTSAEALQFADEVAARLGEASPIDAALAADPRDVTALEAKARRAIRKRDSREAAATLQAALAVEPMGSPRWQRLWWSWISLLVSDKRFDEAEQSIAHVEEAFGATALVEYAKALTATARGDHETAIGVWASFLARRPGQASARLMYAGSLLRVGRAQEAAQEVRRAMKAGGTSEKAWVLLADALYRAGDVPAAIEAVEQGLQAYPDGVQILTIAADIYQAAGRTGDAIELRQKLTQAAPEERENYLGLAELALMSGDPAAATRWIDRAVTGEPSPRAFFLRAVALYRSGKQAEADGIVEEFSGQRADDPETALRTARYYMETARPEKALPWFRRVVEARPEDVSVRIGLARALSLSGRPEEGLDLLTALEKEHPQDPAVEIGKVSVLLVMERYDEALDTVRALLDRRSDLKEAYQLESQILTAMGRLDEAEKVLEQGRGLPGGSSAEDYLGAQILLMRLPSMPKAEARAALASARESLRRISRRRPDLAEVWKILATIGLQLRDPRDCLSCLEKIQGLSALDADSCNLGVQASRMLGDPEAELEWRERLASFRPEDADNWIEIARLRLDVGDAAGAGEVLARVRSMMKQPDEEQIRRVAGLLYRLEQPGEAERFLQRSLEPMDPGRALLVRVRVLLDRKRIDEAERITAGPVEDPDASADTWYARALALRAAGRPEEAVAAYERVMALGGQDVDAACEEAGLLADLGRTERAMEVVRGAMRKDPAALRPRLLEAELLIADGQWDSAVREIEKIVADHPELPEARLWKVRILMRGLEDPATGITWDDFTSALDDISQDTVIYNDALLLRATAEMRRGLLLEASEHCRSVLRRKPDSLQALRMGVSLAIRRQAFAEAREMIQDSARRSRWTVAHVELMGEVALENAKLEARRDRPVEAKRSLAEAEAAFRKVVEAIPDRVPAWIRLAEVLSLEGKTDEAREAVARWTTGDRVSEAAAAAWMRILREQGRRAEAEAFARGWLSEHPSAGFGAVEALLVQIMIDEGKTDEALDRAREMARRTPDSPEAWFLVGQACLASGKHDEAVDAAARALECEQPPSPDSLERYASILFGAGRAEEAARVLEDLIESHSNRSVALNNLAWILASSEPPDLDRALELVRRARAVAPDDPDVLDTEGMIQWKRGDPAWAADLFRRSLERRPSVEVRLRLAEALAAGGKKEQALEEARKLQSDEVPEEIRRGAQKLIYRIEEEGTNTGTR